MKRNSKFLTVSLAAMIALSSLTTPAYAASAVRPANGTTNNQPFARGTGGSDNFRIPCLVTLDDGTLVAAADARWTTYGDAGGLDTIVSYSKDGGSTWNYTFANYLGDNGNVYNKMSTAFIDPAIATDGETVYMIADLYPAGYGLNSAKETPSSGKSHDENGNILLIDAREWNKDVWGSKRKNASNYTFHLEKADKGYVIKNNSGQVVEGYKVDEFFNISGKDVKTNLFEADSPFQVWPTDYLYLTKSTNGGKDWSAPTIINLRNENEQTLLVGPGRGMVASDGTLIFTAYHATNGKENTSVIYSKDQGQTWARGASVNEQTSEAAVTQVGDKLYMFTRYGGYYVSNDLGQTWSAKKNVGLNYNLKCQISAITYPKLIDGKPAIILSVPDQVPGNVWLRRSGNIFVGLVDNEHETIDWKYKNKVNGDAFYAYSCLTLLQDGSIGLLYESGDSDITYRHLNIEDLTKGATIGSLWCVDEHQNPVNKLVLAPSASKELTLVAPEGATVTATSSDEEAVTVKVSEGKVTVSASAQSKPATVTLTSGNESYHFEVIVSDATNYEFVDLKVGESKSFMDRTGNYADQEVEGLDPAVASVEMTGQDAQTVKIVVNAQKANAQGSFEGEKVDLSKCLFTFEKQTDGKFHISNQLNANTKVYLTPKTAQAGNRPLTTTGYKVEVTASEGLFSFKQVEGSLPSQPNNGGVLYLHRSGNKVYNFDRQSGIDANCKYELFKQDASNKEGVIPGYTKVTTTDELENGAFIIAANINDAYYVLNPSQSTNGWEYLAKVVVDEVPTQVEATVQVGDTKDFNGEIKGISSNLWTFTKKADNQYYISNQLDENNTVYLTPKTATSGNMPLTANGQKVQIAKQGSNGFSFQQVEGTVAGAANNGSWLYFHRAGAANDKIYTYDRNGSYDINGCNFDIFKQKAEILENDEIPGFEKISELTDITDGGQYLIAAKVNEKYYVLNPSKANNKYNYVAKVTGDVSAADVSEARTTITIKGLSDGVTSAKIGEKTYFIDVKNKVQTIALGVGDTYPMPTGIVKVENKNGVTAVEQATVNEFAPYKEVNALTPGKYLLGVVSKGASYVMSNTMKKAEGNTPSGLALIDKIDYNVRDYSMYMWDIQAVDGGYTMQNPDGKYLHINQTSVSLSDEPQTLTINTRSGGGFSVSAGGYYLNNWGDGNYQISAWNADNNTMRLLQGTAVDGIVARALGQATVTTNGITYHVSVRCTNHTFGEWEVTTAPTCVAKGEETRTCSACGETETREVAATGEHTPELTGVKEATCTEKGYTGDQKCTVCQTVVEKGKETPALGHQFGEWTVTTAPTCDAKGEETRTCSRCDHSETREVAATGKHTLEVVNVKEATCIDKGYTGDKVCTVCQTVVEKGQDTPALGHTFGKWEVQTPATDTQVGTEVRECSVCHAKETREISKLKVNKDKLQALYDAALPKYLEKDYTAETWKAYQEAMKAAKNVLYSGEVTQKQVDEMVKTLQNAIDELVKVSTEQPESVDRPLTGDATKVGSLMVSSGAALLGVYLLLKSKKEEE